MDRRHALAAFAAFAASPALAQSTQGQPAMPGPRTSMSDGMNQVGQVEMDHMLRTMRAGTMSLETSKIAEGKAQHPRVKQFAAFETAEQQTISEVLKSMQDTMSTASTEAASRGSSTATTTGSTAAQAGAIPAVVPGMDQKAQEMVRKLQQAKAGAEFDRDYVQGQIMGHRELLDIQEDYLKSGKNREHVNVAKLARGQIKEHLALLQDIETELRRG
jgi:putative membrane protein